MTAVYICGGIVLFLGILAFLRAELRVVYDEDLRFYLRVLGLSVRVFDSGKPLPIPEVLRLLSYLTKDILKHFFRGLRIFAAKVHVAVATGDAASTALLYAAVCSGVSGLAGHLDAMDTLRGSRKSDVQVTADFLSERTKADIDLGFSLRIYQIVYLLCKYLFSYLRHRKAERKKHPRKSRKKKEKTVK